LASDFRTPGVKIEEFTPPPPIQGLGTSTAAFVGIAAQGEVNEPTLITSFDRFQEVFGPPVAGTHLWHAVRGFYRNGGTSCQVVRGSNGRAAEWVVNANNGRPVLTLTARQLGATGATIDIVNASLLAAAPAYRPRARAVAAAIGVRQINVQADGATVANLVAQRFKPGDFLAIAGLTDRPQVVGVTGATIRLSTPLSAALAAGVAITLASVRPADTVIRLQPAALLGPNILVRGTILTITQGATTATGVVRSVKMEPLAEGGQTYRVTFRTPIGAAFNLDPAGAGIQADSNEHTLTYNDGSNVVFANLSMDAGHPNYLVSRLNDDAGGPLRAELVQPPPPGALPATLPAPTGGAALPTTNGANENLLAITAQNLIDGLDALRAVDDVNMVCVPDRPNAAGETTLAVQQAMITHCELQGDRIAILDSDPGLPPFDGGGVTGVTTQRLGLASERGFGSFYYPNLLTSAFGGGPPRLTPPCGHVAGIFARADSEVGVHKSPANYVVRDALGLERRLNDEEQGQLNIQGINAFRIFQEAGRPILWGARTTATDTNWRYVAIRRLMLNIEESIAEGINYAIFDVNNQRLWKRVKKSIDDYLTTVWRTGALFGTKPEEAFGVRIDDELNPFSQMQLGILTIEVWVQPAYPVEFIRLRIGISESGTEITEF